MGRASNGLVVAWERRVAKQRRSRLSIAEFCSQEGVSPASFYAWRRRLRGAQPRSSLFVPVALPTPAIIASSLRIELPGGAILSLSADAPVELVTATIRAVVLSTVAEPSTC
jgi:hypothetical protein